MSDESTPMVMLYCDEQFAKDMENPDHFRYVYIPRLEKVVDLENCEDYELAVALSYGGTIH